MRGQDKVVSGREYAYLNVKKMERLYKKYHC